jgi:hypothetical protein
MSQNRTKRVNEVTLVHCPIVCPDLTQKEHFAAIFFWR